MVSERCKVKRLNKLRAGARSGHLFRRALINQGTLLLSSVMLSVLAASAIGWAPVTPPINTLARAPAATMSENDNFNPRVPHELEPRASKADLCANPLHEIFPTEELSPVEVTDLQLQALQQADARFFWRFVSPEGKRATGS